jgi:radical SAM superfamily enzyme YgiQ (UPF0313 family)
MDYSCHGKQLRFLLVNPWIYDFAAYNLWARPLGLLKVAEYLSRFDASLHLIDCTEGHGAIKQYNTGKYMRTTVKKPDVLQAVPRRYSRYGISVDEFAAKLCQLKPVHGVFLTSIMTYWYPGVQKAVEIVREILPEPLIFLGGIYASLYPDHARKTVSPDFVHQGSLQHNPPDIERIFNIKKVRRSTPYYQLNLYEKMAYAPVMTSTGCPFACSYCAAGFLNPAFSQRPVNEVVDEIMTLTAKGVRDFAFYDDALLVNRESHIKPLLRKVIQSGVKIRFHCPNGLHARYIDNELAGLMKQAGFKTIRVSLETVNTERQVAASGAKVSSDELVKAINYLKSHGLSKHEIGVYLMYGLPGQSLEEVQDGIRLIKSLGVRINLTEYSPLPETESFQQLTRQGILSENTDPLLLNNTVFSCLFSGYSQRELDRLKRDVIEYNRA